MTKPTQGEAQTEALTRERLRADVARIVGEPPEEIGDDDNLIDYGLDSMRVLNLASRWSRDGVELPFAEMIEAPTLNDWWRLVERQHREGE